MQVGWERLVGAEKHPRARTPSRDVEAREGILMLPRAGVLWERDWLVLFLLSSSRIQFQRIPLKSFSTCHKTK